MFLSALSIIRLPQTRELDGFPLTGQKSRPVVYYSLLILEAIWLAILLFLDEGELLRLLVLWFVPLISIAEIAL